MPSSRVSLAITALVLLITMSTHTHKADALMPYTRSLYDLMLPIEDPFRVLEQSPLTVPRGLDTPLALARADWKETATHHVIALDVPGLKKEDVKIEVEENRVVRISGERKEEREEEGDKWHRAERTNGKFWRQFKLPATADLDHVKAHIEDGVLKITVPKVAEQHKKQPKVITIAGDDGSGGEDLKATKAGM